MTFEIYFDSNNTTTDLSNYVVGEVNVQVRRDYAFAEGSLNLIVGANVHASLTKNIPPFTICRLNTKKFLCSSVCRYYQIQGKDANNQPIKNYYHEVKLLDMMAICETFLLGAKTESKLSDLTSLDQILELINNKYPEYVVSFSSGRNYLTGSHDYTFHAGTTLYDVLKDYGEKNKVKFSHSSSLYSNGAWHINISCYPNEYAVYDEVEGVGLYDPINPLSLSLEQNVDNYCKHLETIQNNVVDRNNETRFNDMTCRTTNAAMNADSAEILLPTNVEAITKFIVNDYVRANTEIICPDIITADWIINNGGSNTGTQYTWAGTYQDLIDSNTSYGGHSNVFQWIAESNGINSNSLLATQFVITIDTSYNYYSCSDEVVNYWYVDWTQFVLEETEWNSLSVYDKPKYAVYKSGGNKIYNLNASYQADFIHIILGQTVYNYLHSNTPEQNAYIDNNNYIYLKYDVYDDDPTHHSYTIKGIPMIDNFILKDTKTNLPLNETDWKDMTRTYQNSSNPVEFESLIDDMQQQNRVLGSNEMSYEIPLATILDNKNYIIKDTNNVFWNVNSIIYTFKPNYAVATFNCSKEPLKIADVIGVEYQYNPTKLPTENIVVRPLYYETSYSNDYDKINYNYVNGWDILLQVITTLSNNTNKEVLIRPVICEDASGNYYIYATMLDNYSAGKQSINASGSNYQIVDIPYCDNNYRATSITLNLICMRQSLSNQFSEKMPNITTSDLSGMTYVLSTIVAYNTIYKDERETLAFTIKVNKPTN